MRLHGNNEGDFAARESLNPGPSLFTVEIAEFALR